MEKKRRKNAVWILFVLVGLFIWLCTIPAVQAEGDQEEKIEKSQVENTERKIEENMEKEPKDNIEEGQEENGKKEQKENIKDQGESQEERQREILDKDQKKDPEESQKENREESQEENQKKTQEDNIKENTEENMEEAPEEIPEEGKGESQTDPEKLPEDILPKLCAWSAVNDYGTTVTDEEGTFYFRDSLTVTLYFSESEEEEEGEKEPFVLQREGEMIPCEDGFYQDILYESGNYTYVVRDGKEELREEVLTVCAGKYEEAPIVSLHCEADPVSVEGTDYFDKDPKITIQAGAAPGIAKVEYRTEDGIYVPLFLLPEDDRYLFGVSSSLELPLTDQEKAKEGAHRYTVQVTDLLGGRQEVPIVYVIDQTAPDEKIFVSYQSDGTNPSMKNQTGIMSFISNIEERLFGKKKVSFELYVKDKISSGSEEAKASGIDWEDFKGQIGTVNEKIKIKDLVMEEEASASFFYDGISYEGYTRITGCLVLPLGEKGDVKDQLLIRRLKDRAGNVAERENLTGAVLFTLDQTAPVLSVDYGGGTVEEDAKRIFYQEDAVLSLSLKEEQYGDALDEEGQPFSPRVTITGANGLKGQITPWEQQESGALASVLFPALKEPEETVYDFLVMYEDGAGNLLEKEEGCLGNTENGCFAGYTIIVDNRPPKLIDFLIEGESKSRADGQNVYRNREGADVTIVFALEDKEAYWNPDQVQLEIFDQSTKDLAVAVGGRELQWQDEGEIHQACFAFDGSEGMGVSAYEVRLSYEDRAGNLLIGGERLRGGVTDGMYRSEIFWLDHEAPVLDLSYPKAVRLVQKENPDPMMDERDMVPRAGYIAYYDQEIEVAFSIREKCGFPVIQDGRMTDLVDFKLQVCGLKGEYSPEIDWKESKEGYEGRFVLQKEDHYTISLEYKDLAENFLQEGQEELLVSQEGIYTSPVLVLDRTAPVLQVSYVNQSLEPLDVSTLPETEGRICFSEPVYLKLELIDENLRGQEVKEVLSGLLLSDCEGRRIESSSASLYMEELDAEQMIQGSALWYVPLLTEAVYQLPLGAEDLAGNASVCIWENAVIDRSSPELVLSYEVEKSGFLDVFRYGNPDFLFADHRVTIKASAVDPISGIRFIKFFSEEEDGKTREYVQEFSPAEKNMFSVTLPAEGEDFKGKVTVQAYDWSGNCIYKECAPVVESRQKHDRTGGLTITTLTTPGRMVGGKAYYNTDVRFRVQAKDMFSGLRRVSLMGGATIVQVTDYKKKETEGVVCEYEEEFLLEAAGNNENEVFVKAEYQDYAGHISTAEQSYNIDITPPKISVIYDLDTPSHGQYYGQTRTATVTVRERNLDPADVEFWMTNTEGGVPLIENWTTSGEGDDTLHVCQVTFAEDGDYTFSLAVTDLAGNRTEYGQADAFTIDQTAPILTISYDQNQSENGFYYKKGRTAFIEVLEHNFDPSLVEVLMTAEDGKAAPSLSGWVQEGDFNRAAVSFTEDGVYGFSIMGVDLAENSMEIYESGTFIIDQTPPKIEITGVEHQSANNQMVAPQIRCLDENYDIGQTRIWLESFQKGIQEYEGTRREHQYGMECRMEDFAYVPEMDDLYCLQVMACDLAGNQSMEEVLFSVNRFGSVYTLEEQTDLLAGEKGRYYTNQEQDLIITETNVDSLLFREITCNRDGKICTLTEGKDYTVRTEEIEGGWKQYQYTINKSNFSEEGTYVLTLYSEDLAQNPSDNYTKGKKLEFAVDKTGPDILVSGIEDGGQYRENSRRITADVRDNLCLFGAEAVINGIPVTYYASEVFAEDGRIALTAGSANHWQTLQVTARDAAGNQTSTKICRFLITPNLLVQFCMDRPMFYGMWGILCLAAVLAGGIWHFRKRGRK